MFENLVHMPPFNRAGDIRKVLSHFQENAFRHNKLLFYQDDWAERAYFIISGNVALKKWRQDQSSFTLHEKSAGQWLGIAECFAGGAYLCDAVCQAETVVAGISADSLKEIFGLPEFGPALMESIIRDQYILHAKLESSGGLDSISAYLKELCKHPRFTLKEEICLKITQEKLASAVGLTRETVSKHLHQLQDDGVISLARGIIKIENQKLL